MTTFINLQRHFQELSETEQNHINDSNDWENFYNVQSTSTLAWGDVLLWKRVLLLAEAGSGKTEEMKAQEQSLIHEQKYAFFLPLEALISESVTQILPTVQQGEKFNLWKQSKEPAWFFLDSVDELKLTNNSLEKALRRFAKEIEDCMQEVHIIMSCRPSDWRVDADRSAFERFLPLTKTSGTAKNDQNLRVVSLQALNEQQIKTFAEHHGVQSPEKLLAEIELQNAWIFAQRPLDLSGLINFWNRNGRLGTRAEQHEANITMKLKDDPARSDQNILSNDEARIGAEQLALALTLTRLRTIRAAEQSTELERADQALNPDDVLSEWSMAKRQSLLRRALFDPATYGRIRFHHRSIQEYLAAQKLNNLRKKGMSYKDLSKLLFADFYGEKIVIPSMRPIAAWLAIWNDDVCKELLQREPESLLKGGDPESLDMATRKKLLAAIVTNYGHGGWRGLRISLDEKRRLAHPDLADTIQKLWSKNPTNPEIIDLLVDIVEQGKISECADLMRIVAMDPSFEHAPRLVSIRALIACHQNIGDIVESILAKQEIWPDELTASLVVELYPKIISIDQLVVLVERSKATQTSSSGIAYALGTIASTLEISTPHAIDLREHLVALIKRKRDPESAVYSLRSAFSNLTPALAILCTRQLSFGSNRADTALIHAAVIAARFNDAQMDSDSLIDMKNILDRDVLLRESVFWSELNFINDFFPNDDPLFSKYNVENYGLSQPLSRLDLPWLQQALAATNKPSCRRIALDECLGILRQQQTPAPEIKSLLVPLLKDDDSLLQTLEKSILPYEPSASELKYKQDNETNKVRNAQRQEENRMWYGNWLERTLADPSQAFITETALSTISTMFNYIEFNRKSRSSSGADLYNLGELLPVFGEKLTQLAIAYLKTLWRTTLVTLWSEKTQAEGTYAIDANLILSLRGLEAQSEQPEWARCLSAVEARIAASYAMLDHFISRSFVDDLLIFHRDEVDAVWSKELNDQLNVSGENSPPILQILASPKTSKNLKQLLVPRLLEYINAIPVATLGEEWIHRLDSILRIFNDPCMSSHSDIFAAICQRQYEADPQSPLFLIWLRGVFCFNSEQGALLIRKHLTEENEVPCNRAIKIFAGLFSPLGNDRHGSILEKTDPSKRIFVLGTLIRLAYTHIPPEKDEIHETGACYSPSPRDDAAHARSYLTNALFETKSAEAHGLLLELAQKFNSASFSDRFREIAYQRAASDAERAPMSATQVCAISALYETPPHDRDDLFRVMIDRLEDLAHDIAHHDFTDRATLCQIKLETDMRNTLALRLQNNNLYRLACESIVADEKRTDFSLYALTGKQKVVIELKLVHKWTVKQLEKALDAQLVGQYLRHVDCTAGCLLLTDNGTQRQWKHPITKKMLNFPNLLVHLQELAGELELKHNVKLAVFGLDCAPPYLAPAH